MSKRKRAEDDDDCSRHQKLEHHVAELERTLLEKDDRGKEKQPVSVAIAGCRKYTDYKAFCQLMAEWEVDVFDSEHHSIEKFVSGGARGADALAERFAKKRGTPIEVLRPKWNEFGKAAGPMRNTDIVAASDYVVAFPSKNSRGTRDTIRKAERAGKFVTVYEI